MVKNFLVKVLRVIGSRVALNFYFWAVMFDLQYNNATNNPKYPLGIYFSFIFLNLAIIMALVYANNLYFVPRLLARKKRGRYFAIILPLTFTVSILYTCIQKFIAARFPKIDVYQISIITTPISKSWTVAAILDELPTFFIGFLALLLIFTALWFMRDYAKQTRIAEEVRSRQRETELTLLKQQLNPHFLFNTLNNIYGLTLNKSDLAPACILKLSSLMRYMLYEADASLIAFTKEKEAMMSYIELELLRLNDKKIFKYEIIADADYLVPPLLWMALLENIFKHGTRNATAGDPAFFAFEIKENRIRIFSKNLQHEKMGETIDGIGLRNLKKRLEILYPQSHALSVSNDNNYFAVEVNINLA